MKPATAGSPYQVPPEPSRWPAIALAVAVHALLLAFLWFGIDWQNNEPVAVEAEVWDMKTQVAAPPPPPPPEEVQPEPQPAPPPKAAPQPVEKPAVQPDINLEREKKRKELLKKQEEERELQKAKAREGAKAKELAEKKAREEEEKQELKKEAEKKKAEKLAKAKAAAADKARLAKMRADDLKRIMGAAGSTGTAAKSTAPRMDSGYIASISAKVKSTTNYLGSTDLPGNPRVEFHVEQLPTGEVMSVKKIKSSGVAAFDDAVEKGIIKASPLPKKKDGTVERSLEIGFSMKDMN
jgi:colicin import membrane protein